MAYNVQFDNVYQFRVYFVRHNVLVFSAMRLHPEFDMSDEAQRGCETPLYNPPPPPDPHPSSR